MNRKKREDLLPSRMALRTLLRNPSMNPPFRRTFRGGGVVGFLPQSRSATLALPNGYPTTRLAASSGPDFHHLWTAGFSGLRLLAQLGRSEPCPWPATNSAWHKWQSAGSASLCGGFYRAPELILSARDQCPCPVHEANMAIPLTRTESRCSFDKCLLWVESHSPCQHNRGGHVGGGLRSGRDAPSSAALRWQGWQLDATVAMFFSCAAACIFLLIAATPVRLIARL